MKANIRIEEPDDVRLTLTVTLPLKDWKRLIARFEALTTQEKDKDNG